jgi:hypothetical protein
MNVSYSPGGGLPAYQLDMIVNGLEVPVMTGGAWFNPIDQADINAQVPKLLSVASVPATICNWGGDDAVSTEEYVTFLASLIGNCDVHWHDGFRKLAAQRYPDLVRAG